MPHDRKKIASDGLSTDYYVLPPDKRTISELCQYKNMNPVIARIFRTCYALHKYNRKDIDYHLAAMTRLINNVNGDGDFEVIVDVGVPAHATELRHLISHVAMSKSRGDIFKACYRLGAKEGVDEEYDINKIKFFIEDLKEMNARREHI